MKQSASAKRFPVRSLVLAAVLSAVAFLLMFVDFSIPALIPSFIKMDVSDLCALLGSFLLGPVWGIAISAMKNILILLLKGTSTAFVGEASNFILGAVFSFVGGLVYRKLQPRGALRASLLGGFCGAAAMALCSVPSNYFLVYPAYETFYHLPMDAIIGMYRAILPAANTLLRCLVIFNLPFTLCKGLIDAALCATLCRPLRFLLQKK